MNSPIKVLRNVNVLGLIRERLEDQLEISDLIAKMEKKFLNRSRKI